MIFMGISTNVKYLDEQLLDISHPPFGFSSSPLLNPLIPSSLLFFACLLLPLSSQGLSMWRNYCQWSHMVDYKTLPLLKKPSLVSHILKQHSSKLLQRSLLLLLILIHPFATEREKKYSLRSFWSPTWLSHMWIPNIILAHKVFIKKSSLKLLYLLSEHKKGCRLGCNHSLSDK